MSQSVIDTTLEQLVRNRVSEITSLAMTINGQGEYSVNVLLCGLQNTLDVAVFAPAPNPITSLDAVMAVGHRCDTIGVESLASLEDIAAWLRTYAKEGQPS